jgi:hypothetical protein
MWCKAGGQLNRDLLSRRNKESAMFLNEAVRQLDWMTNSSPWGGSRVPWGKSPAIL